MPKNTNVYISGRESSLLDDIIAGRKTVEGRLNKGKFKKYKPGDIILLRRDFRDKNGKLKDGTNIEAKVIVVSVKKYQSFYEMILKEGYKKVIPCAKNAKEASDEYNKYYSSEDQSKYGVLAIRIQLTIDAKTVEIIANTIKNAQKIVEIAGPSPNGYKILTENNIKLAEWEVTNVSSPIVINAYSQNPVKATVKKVNARKMPYKNESVDVFLVSYLSVCSDLWLKIPGNFLKGIVGPYLANRAEKEYLRPKVKKGVNLRIAFLLEAYRCLKPGGIVIMVGPKDEDFPVAKKIGFKILTQLYYAEDQSETSVFIKI
jgi:ASC-1-like (ASCH) protein